MFDSDSRGEILFWVWSNVGFGAKMLENHIYGLTGRIFFTARKPQNQFYLRVPPANVLWAIFDYFNLSQESIENILRSGYSILYWLVVSTPFHFHLLCCTILVLGRVSCNWQEAFSRCLRGNLVVPLCPPDSFVQGKVRIPAAKLFQSCTAPTLQRH